MELAKKREAAKAAAEQRERQANRGWLSWAWGGSGNEKHARRLISCSNGVKNDLVSLYVWTWCPLQLVYLLDMTYLLNCVWLVELSSLP